MVKVILLLVLLFGAYGIAVIMLRRLTENAKQLAALREQMARNDSQLSDQLRTVRLEQEKMQAKLEAEQENKS